MTEVEEEVWLALAIGNSRLHWAQFTGEQLRYTWDTPHLSPEKVQHLIESNFNFAFIPHSLLPTSPSLWIASVVADQSALWQNYSLAHFISLEQVPLQETYSTLGIDRALAVWGAIATVGSPVLVIDAGTALTFTGATGNHLVGGAILPGLQLQFQALGQSTAALPIVKSSDRVALPPHWALNTTDAISSGVIYTLLAGLREFIETWRQQSPDSSIVLTGGDGDRLHQYLKQRSPDLAATITVHPHLIFQGIRSVREHVQPISLP